MLFCIATDLIQCVQYEGGSKVRGTCDDRRCRRRRAKLNQVGPRRRAFQTLDQVLDTDSHFGADGHRERLGADAK